MKILGLCGGSGSGKGATCSVFTEFGIKCIDTDKVYRDIISTDSECSKELVEVFGNQIAAEKGINKAKLREFVFSSKESLKLLNSITHKHILANVRSQINDIKKRTDIKGVVVDAPLLFESGFDKECDATLCIIADDKIRLNRIIMRDGISSELARTRIASQITNSELMTRCTYSIENNGTYADLREKVISFKKTFFD